MSEAHVNFIKQQGFKDASARTRDSQYPALMFQPRVIGVLVLAGVLFQTSTMFLTWSAVLWWNSLMPRLNPFDRLYNSLIAARKGLPALTAAPRPRRFAQGMAATFMVLIGVSLLAGWHTLAWVLEALLIVALSALIFGGFCLGSTCSTSSPETVNSPGVRCPGAEVREVPQKHGGDASSRGRGAFEAA